MDVAGIAVDLPEGPAEPPGESASIQLGRDDDPPAGDVQPPGEPQQRRHLGATTAQPRQAEPAQLLFHRRGHHHAGTRSDPRTSRALAVIPIRRAAACPGAEAAMGLVGVPGADLSGEELSVRVVPNKLTSSPARSLPRCRFPRHRPPGTAPRGVVLSVRPGSPRPPRRTCCVVARRSQLPSLPALPHRAVAGVRPSCWRARRWARPVSGEPRQGTEQQLPGGEAQPEGVRNSADVDSAHYQTTLGDETGLGACAAVAGSLRCGAR